MCKDCHGRPAEGPLLGCTKETMRQRDGGALRGSLRASWGSTQRPIVGWVAEMVSEVGYARTGIVALQGERRWEIGRGYMNARDG